MRSERGASLVVILLALVILGLALWFVINRTAQSTVGALADAGMQLDETKRQRTIADMQAIGRANDLMRADTGSYARDLAALQAGKYLVQVPAADGWGNPFTYTTDADGFRLTSLGSDGRPGPAPPSPWQRGAYPCDLIMENGALTQAPAGR